MKILLIGFAMLVSLASGIAIGAEKPTREITMIEERIRTPDACVGYIDITTRTLKVMVKFPELVPEGMEAASELDRKNMNQVIEKMNRLTRQAEGLLDRVSIEMEGCLTHREEST